MSAVPGSYDLNDLTSDIGHLTTLIGVIATIAIDLPGPDVTMCQTATKEVNKLSDLLWIARDLADQINGNVDNAVIAERKAVRMTGGQRNG